MLVCGYGVSVWAAMQKRPPLFQAKFYCIICFKRTQMKSLFVACFLYSSLLASGQPSLLLKKQRPAQLDMTAYTQIAVGDIVGPTGAKTEESRDLTDALTAKLFNARTVEVLDQNALNDLLKGQRYSDLQVMDDKTKQALNKKLSNALLITGRLQSSPLEQKLIYQDQGIVINGCDRTYYYQVKGNATLQLKILDVKSGRMVFSDAVTKPVDKRTKEDCKIPEKLNVEEIARLAVKDLSEEIAKMLVPYEVETVLQFSEPGLFKSPFKQLKEAVSYLQINNTDAGLAILKNYTESKDVKDKNRDEAWYNYSLGLLYANRYNDAKAALQMAASLNSSNVAKAAAFIKLMDEEEQVARKLEGQALARQKAQQAAEPEPAQSPTTQTKSARPAAKAKIKKA